MSPYRLFRGKSGNYFLENTATKKQESLRTQDKEEANDPCAQSGLNQLYFGRRSSFRVSGERKTMSVCDCHDFGTLARLVLPTITPWPPFAVFPHPVFRDEFIDPLPLFFGQIHPLQLSIIFRVYRTKIIYEMGSSYLSGP